MNINTIEASAHNQLNINSVDLSITSQTLSLKQRLSLVWENIIELWSLIKLLDEGEMY